MEDIYRTAVKKTWDFIINTVTEEQASNVIDHLVENNVLDTSTKEWIKREKSKVPINRKLFGLVSKKGPVAFQGLVHALLQNQLNLIADKLLSNLGTQSSDPTSVTTSPNTKPDDITQCNICMSDSKSVAFIPCGHTSCISCGNRFLNEGTCCFCKQTVTDILRIYI